MKGQECTLPQYHDRQDESMYVYSGEVLIDIGDSDGKLQSFTLHPGDVIRVPAGVRHRMKAIEDTTIFEFSTPELNDMIRIEDDYGRVGRVLWRSCAYSPGR